MRRKLVAVFTVVVATIGGAVAFMAVTLRKVANMRLSQYAYEVAEEAPSSTD